MGRSTTGSSSTSSLSSSRTPPFEGTPSVSSMPAANKIEKKQATSGLRKIVVLKLAPSKLAAFKETAVLPPASNTNSNTGSSANSPRNPSPLATSTTPQVGSPASEAASVQATGFKPGAKRGRQPGAPPARPGRKKQKIDGNGSGLGVPGTSGPHKLGPKANQGAINAQLRALDRTGKPCKRWSKAGFTLKSFTGFAWTVPTWATEKKVEAPAQPPVMTTGVQTSGLGANGSAISSLNSMGGALLDITSNAS